jgi:methylmalonyl-CoA/ethylmalonyl-CoA epimerase
MRVHHVGIAVNSIAKHAEQYRRALGIPLTSEVVEDEVQNVRVAFAEAGDILIEFVEPLGDDSPVTALVSRGGGLYHVCYVVRDVEAAIERVRQAGGRLISGPSPARAFDGRQIAFVFTPDRSVVEFLEDQR